MSQAKPNKENSRYGRFSTLLILVMAALIAVALFSTTKLIKEEPRTPIDGGYYQYFGDQISEYDDIEIVQGENGLYIEINDDQAQLDQSPLYSKSDKSFVLPVDMGWLDVNTNKDYKLSALNTIEMDEEGMTWYVTKDNKYKLGGGVLYSGNGTFVMLEPVSIIFSDLQHDVDTLSFYSTVNHLYRIYNYAKQDMFAEETKNNNTVLYANSGFELDLTIGRYTARNGEQRLLVASPKYLKAIEER